ncbi:DUF445 domain-containing protein [Nocardioides immobilis]|uniref:DUF445 domain-containing protein n=1 Tax=Nocardioides immobilis TaxID=2049295 RepID=A0A417Y7F7_9ACTN|nr:DUF445 domain-containing protein [Nocardioides immobilis]RHW28678.1 DUF445 domain-containing protein [Nocardioides immobilis]
MIAAVVNTPTQAWDVFIDHPFVLLLMPVVSAFIGWITKVVAIEMAFRPTEFMGVGVLGWQGQLPRRAAKFGAEAADIILDNVVDPREMVDRLDPHRVATECDDIMLDAINAVARDILGPRWDQVPQRAKALAIARARSRAPQMVENLLQQAKDNIDELFNVSYIVTSELIKDKALLVELVRGPMAPIMTFMKRFGAVFGFVVGAIQMVVFAFTESHIVIPIAGLIVGLVSDWIALRMMFDPKEPKRYLGVFKWQGLAFAERDHFIKEYAKVAAEKVLGPELIMRALLDGPLADRLFALVHQEVEDAIDAELGILEPLVPAAIGSRRYDTLRRSVVTEAQGRVRGASERLGPYIIEALDVERTVEESLGALSNQALEDMLRPVFKDDEWLVVAVGGGLGFAVGELQVLLLTELAGL